MLLSKTIASQGWKSNKEIVLALEEELPSLAEWVRMHPSPDTILGKVPGVSAYFNRHAVTEEDMLEIISIMHKYPWFFEPLTEILKATQPFEVPTVERIDYKDLGKALHKTFKINEQPRLLDRYFYTLTKKSLEDAIKFTGYEYGRWIEEEMDCDEWAGRLWGDFQRAIPGNLAIGYVTICGKSYYGKEQCHALLLALTSEGFYWIENTGKIYPIGELPGWDNSSIYLNIIMF